MGKREETRTRMMDAASRNFRAHGFSGIGVDGIAKTAGVTSGAFYAHLGSKDAAFQAILETGLDEVLLGIPNFQKESGSDWVSAFADYYLDPPHRVDLECGCAMASLTTDVWRSSDDLHGIYQDKMSDIARTFAKGLTGEGREERAWACLSALIGGLNMLRAMRPGKEADRIAAAIKQSVLSVAGSVAD